jgi:hypothetical protein
VNWGLFLPPGWLDDRERRRRAKIPDEVSCASPELCAVDTVTELVTPDWGLRRRPAVLDARELDATVLVEEFTRRGVPFVMRIGGTTRLIGFDQGLPERGERLLQAQQLTEAAKRFSRPVGWVDPDYSITRSILVGGTRVTVPSIRRPGAPGLPERALTLVGGWSGAKGQSPELWLSNMVEVPAVALLRLGRLTRRVAKDFAEVGAKVGMRDFEGRNYAGWHRHATLCSVAHAISVLSSARRQGFDNSQELSA